VFLVEHANSRNRTPIRGSLIEICHDDGTLAWRCVLRAAASVSWKVPVANSDVLRALPAALHG
jgi:hypothetical protein